jgi:hypothetical protein
MKIRVLFGVLVLLLIGVSCAYGFDDSVQRYETGQISDIWTVSGSGSATIVNYPISYATSNSIYLQSTVHNQPITITNIIPFNSDYFSFTVRSAHFTDATWGKAHVKTYDSDGFLLLDVGIEQFLRSYNSNDRYEFYTSSGSLLLDINGGFVANVGVISSDISYVSFYVERSTTIDSSVRVRIDDITTSSIVGMNEEWTQAATYIDTSYGIQSYASFPSSTFTMTSSRVGSGTITNTTTLINIADFVRWNRTAIYGTDWGLYHVQLFRDSTKLAETTFTYFDSTISGSVAYDQDLYSQGQTANIDYTISSADFATYTYYLKLINVYGTVQDTYTLTAASGTESPTLTDYDSGIYYAILSRTNKASGVNEEFAYDYASVTETVYIIGNVTEAVSGTNMQNVSIQYLQGSTYYNTTSAADGTYNVSDLSVSVSTTITANATYVNDTNFGNNSYNLSTFSFTPLSAEIYNVDLILFDVNHTYDNVSAYGLVYDNIYHQTIESATVNIYNSTWSNSTTSTATGYYVFHNLTANGTYSINATATGYIDTIDYSINTTTINATRQDVPMSTLYTVTVKARDATTLAYLSDFTATLDGTEGTAVNGTVTFNNIEYGLHAISAIADDFYPSATTPLIDEDTQITLDLTRLASEYYSPHRVKFTVKTLWGTLYSGVAVNVYTGSSASGDTLYTGTTGTDGAVAFELAEYIQYTLTFIDASQSIDESITLYPIENSYPVYIYDTLAPDDEDIESEEVAVSVTTAEINDTHAYINVTYTDAMNETTDLNIYINQSDESDPFNQTIITFANLGATSSVTHSFIIDDYPGQAYFINIGATHTTFGDIQRTYSVRFDGMLEDYGFSKIWVWIGVGGMMFVAGMFKASKAEQGALVVCVVGWVFMGFGFFDSLGSQAVTSMAAGLSLATVLAVGANMSKRNRDETV